MKRVLVTGATGFIGRHSLEPLLDIGYEVHATYHDEPLEMKSVVWHKADLLDKVAITHLCAHVRATHLLHFAWYVDSKDYKTSLHNTMWAERTIDLLHAFKSRGGTRAVMAGTCMEYDWNMPQEFLSEKTSPLNPSTPYGIAKLHTYNEASTFSSENDLSFAWGRIFLLYGPYEAPSRLVPYVINSLLRNEEALCTSGEQVRDILHVRDVATAFVTLLDSDVVGAINIASGEAISVKEIIVSIADMIGRPDLLKLGARDLPETEHNRIVADVTKLRTEVGWRPSINLLKGLASTIEWWRDQPIT